MLMQQMQEEAKRHGITPSALLEAGIRLVLVDPSRLKRCGTTHPYRRCRVGTAEVSESISPTETNYTGLWRKGKKSSGVTLAINPLVSTVNKTLQVHIPLEAVSPDNFEMSTATTVQTPPLYALLAR